MNQKKMSKKQFWARLVIYIIFGAVIPFVFLMWRFQLFSKVSSISIGGWGIVAIIFVAVFAIKLMVAIRKGLPFSMLTQVLDGVCKVIIPLIIGAVIVSMMEDLHKQIFQFLMVVIICETVAIVANPLKQWAHENKIEEGNENLKTLLSSLTSVNKDKQ